MPVGDRATVALVAAGGAAGTAARLALGEVFPTPAHAFPTTTVTINVAGALLLGLLMHLLAARGRVEGPWRALLGVGVLGAFTTFSTMATDAAALARDDHLGVAAASVGITVVVGIGAAWLGARLGALHTPLADEGES